jgi:hypothetical protein
MTAAALAMACKARKSGRRSAAWWLPGISRQAGVGDDFEESHQGNHVAPEPVGFHAQAAHQDRKRHGSQQHAADAGGAHRGEEPAVAQHCAGLLHRAASSETVGMD